MALADDNDRWIHALAGSRELALTVGAMRGATAYRELLAVDADVTYTPAMREAEARVTAEVAATHALAAETRRERRVGDVTVLAAWCAGYPSEIGDAWGKATPNAVVALYDTKSDGVSFRRSPACRSISRGSPKPSAAAATRQRPAARFPAWAGATPTRSRGRRGGRRTVERGA